ncbi:thiamine diphosphokinase [Pseudooctadecabacter sp.]|uniref:thiamine diphosphokinase n=1 Tax=Pseudooctadecabacter sp. TaxID=1966338 RepID=UPI0025E91610|nr:thiamine diphosphokinase [Pseudooctadecabacter sp.]
MNSPIVSSPKPITLIGGAQVAHSLITEALKYGADVVCADGGADTALWAGLDPVAVIGDMDSVSEAAKDAYSDVLHQIAEQDSTDFDKALRNIDAPLIIGVGFLGQRLDHAMAALHVLQKYDRPVVLLGEDDLVFVVPDQITMTVPVGLRISLMPLAEPVVTTHGLRWEVTEATMSMRDFIGSSNEAAAEVVTINATPGLAVIMPPEALQTVVAALTGVVPAQ